MSKEDVEGYIRSQKRSTLSVEEQIEVSHGKWDEGVSPHHEGLKPEELEDELGLELEYNPRTSLTHLEDIEIVEEFTPPGPDTLAIAEWMNDGDGEIVLGEVGDAAEEGLTALVEDVESSPPDEEGATADGSWPPVCRVVADEFDVVPDKVADFLRGADDPVDVLNKAVQAIKDDETVELPDEYGEIVFINRPYRYRLTEKAVGLYNE